MSERAVDVWVQIQGKDVLAGRLWCHRRRRTESQTFAYDSSYLGLPTAYGLDPALKLMAGSQHTFAGRLRERSPHSTTCMGCEREAAMAAKTPSVSHEPLAEDLLKAAAAGDPEALERFVERYWERVHRVAYLISCDSPGAEDIAQEAMIKALNALPDLDTDRPIEPWLDRVAANAARDWLRSRARRPEILQDHPDEPGPEPEGDVLAELTQHALPVELASALGHLEPGFREVVVLRHLLDMGTEEIAARLGIAAATVRSRDHRALRLLRTGLQEGQPTDA